MKYLEGIAFALTAKDNIGSGLAILIAMIVRVIPMKLGYAQILSKSGLRQGYKLIFILDFWSMGILHRLTRAFSRRNQFENPS